MNDPIDRQDAIRWVKTECNPYGKPTLDFESGIRVIEHLEQMPSAQPEQKWIPLETRPMDEEERLEWSEKLGYDIEYEDAVIYTSQLPDDGQEVLTCNRYGHITTDKFANDPDYGCFFEEYGEMDGIVAWMPLPKPYEEEGEE